MLDHLIEPRQLLGRDRGIENDSALRADLNS